MARNGVGTSNGMFEDGMEWRAGIHSMAWMCKYTALMRQLGMEYREKDRHFLIRKGFGSKKQHGHEHGSVESTLLTSLAYTAIYYILVTGFH